MSLLDLVRLAPKLANKITRPIQPVVMYERYTGSDGSGSKTYAGAVPLHAIEEWKSVQVRTLQGNLTVSRATITLLDIVEVVNATNGQGVSESDRFTLADGSGGVILDLQGFVDALTGHPIATTVILG